jgi:hypothetical protein
VLSYIAETVQSRKRFVWQISCFRCFSALRQGRIASNAIFEQPAASTSLAPEGIRHETAGEHVRAAFVPGHPERVWRRNATSGSTFTFIATSIFINGSTFAGSKRH